MQHCYFSDTLVVEIRHLDTNLLISGCIVSVEHPKFIKPPQYVESDKEGGLHMSKTIKHNQPAVEEQAALDIIATFIDAFEGYSKKQERREIVGNIVCLIEIKHRMLAELLFAVVKREP
jgi:hypothetical protein